MLMIRAPASMRMVLSLRMVSLMSGSSALRAPFSVPYTTLFRSHGPPAAHHLCNTGRAGALARARRMGLRWRRVCGFLDRKSTRLNSSHGYISYAVFCFKKKNNYFRVLSGILLAADGRNAYD